MNRLSHLIVLLLLLLGVPAISQAQYTRDELLKAIERAGGRKTKVDSFDMYRWDKFNLAGWRAISKGEYVTAEHEFASAIGVARDQAKLENDHRLLARSYFDYAYAIEQQGRLAEAEPLLKWVLIAREAEHDPDSPPIAQALNQLGTLYYELGRLAESEAHLRRAIESQAKADKPKPFEHSRSHTMLGLLMVSQHRYDEAEEPFRKALAIREKWRGASHVDTGDALSNLAWLYLQRGKIAEARPLITRALRIFETSRGPLDPSYAHTLHGLAKVQSNEAEQDQAEANFLQAIAIWDRLPVLDARALVEVLKDYADFLEKLGRVEDANKIKARLSPLKAKFVINEARVAACFRLPLLSPENDQAARRVRG